MWMGFSILLLSRILAQALPRTQGAEQTPSLLPALPGPQDLPAWELGSRSSQYHSSRT